MWPTSQATLDLSPPLLFLRTDTIWPRVRTTAQMYHIIAAVLQCYQHLISMSRRNVPGTIYVSVSFYLGAQDSSLKLWDLRKLKNFKTITLDNNYEVGNNSCDILLIRDKPVDYHILPNFSFSSFFCVQVKSLVFDQSGTYLAVGGSDIRVYICKQWSEVLNFTGEGIRSASFLCLLSSV